MSTCLTFWLQSSTNFQPFLLIIHNNKKARKRSKTLVAQLQSQVEELTKDKAELKRSNDLMRTQLDLLEQQNRTLLMNQLSAQPSSSQLTGGSFAPGGSISSPNALMSMSNNVGNHANGISSMSSGNPMFNLPSAAFAATGNGTIGSGSLVGDASGLSNASASFMGMGNGGGGSGLGQLSLLDRLRLQQQLQLQQQQRQQQQQLGLMAPSSGVNGRASLNERDLLLNNIRNNSNNNNSNFLG